MFTASLTLVICFVVYLLYVVVKRPSNERNWSLDQAVLPFATFAGDTVTIHNVRNFTYHSTTDYIPQYYDRTYNLSALERIDYIVEPFAGFGAAHTFVSFGFSDGTHVAISVEIRKEVGEVFSPLAGILRAYELMYVIADERDVIALRTEHRRDDVYLYPIKASPAEIRELFMAMLSRANTLTTKPEFYNTITNNCTTNIASHINTLTPNTIPWDIRLVLPRNSDRLLYELGLMDTALSLAEARSAFKINDRVPAALGKENFSQLIRTAGNN